MVDNADLLVGDEELDRAHFVGSSEADFVGAAAGSEIDLAGLVDLVVADTEVDRAAKGLAIEPVGQLAGILEPP